MLIALYLYLLTPIRRARARPWNDWRYAYQGRATYREGPLIFSKVSADPPVPRYRRRGPFGEEAALSFKGTRRSIGRRPSAKDWPSAIGDGAEFFPSGASPFPS